MNSKINLSWVHKFKNIRESTDKVKNVHCIVVLEFIENF